jgi:hypothetical protein
MTEATLVSSSVSVDAPDRFLVLWQEPVGRLYHRVGTLERGAAGYEFAYEPAAREISGFTPFAEFPDWDVEYRSDALFATFANRVMTPRREGYDRYVQSLGLSTTLPEPFEVLARTLGTRATDHVQLLPVPRTNEAGVLSLYFLVHGARHVDPDATRLASVRVGDALHLAAEPDNPRSPLAVLVGSAPAPTRDVALGYVPQALAGLVLALLESQSVQVSAAHVNLPADGPIPDHMRLLARLDAVVPDDFNAEALLNS